MAIMKIIFYTIIITAITTLAEESTINVEQVVVDGRVKVEIQLEVWIPVKVSH